jgi:DNA polymerase III subunit delta'
MALSTNLLQRVQAQPVATSIVKRALEEDRLHHAYLFEGPGGIGKRLTAYGVAQVLVCEARKNNEACGSCRSCVRVHRAYENKSAEHPDVIRLGIGAYEPSAIGRKTPESTEISIDQIRTMVLARSAFGPVEGRAKIFILDGAEKLSIGAANALLKILEEPEARTRFLLLSTRAKSLLPTIRSRALAVRFRPLPIHVQNTLIAENDVRRDYLDLSDGSFDTASELAQEANRAMLDALANALDAGDLEASLQAAATAKGKREVVASALALLANRTRQAARDGDAKGLRLAERFELIARAERDLRRNMAPQLCLESFVLRALQS